MTPLWIFPEHKHHFPNSACDKSRWNLEVRVVRFYKNKWTSQKQTKKWSALIWTDLFNSWLKLATQKDNSRCFQMISCSKLTCRVMSSWREKRDGGGRGEAMGGIDGIIKKQMLKIMTHILLLANEMNAPIVCKCIGARQLCCAIGIAHIRSELTICVIVWCQLYCVWPSHCLISEIQINQKHSFKSKKKTFMYLTANALVQPHKIVHEEIIMRRKFVVFSE